MCDSRTLAITKLIINSRDYSLEEYCLSSLNYLNKADDLDELIMQSVLDIYASPEGDEVSFNSILPTYLKDNAEAKSLIDKLYALHKQGLLPCLHSAIGITSIVDAVLDHSHEDYIETHYGEGEKVELFRFVNNSDKTEEMYVNPSMINVISTLEDSEVLVSSCELPGYVYVLYHDSPDLEQFATSYENLIKTMISLELMCDPDVFLSVLSKVKSSDHLLPEDP